MQTKSSRFANFTCKIILLSTISLGEKTIIDANAEITQMLKLYKKHFKAVNIKMLQQAIHTNFLNLSITERDLLKYTVTVDLSTL